MTTMEFRSLDYSRSTCMQSCQDIKLLYSFCHVERTLYDTTRGQLAQAKGV